MLGKVGKDFSIQSDITFLQKRDELGVGKTLGFEERRHAHVPKAAEVAFLVSPVGEGVGAGVEDGLIGLALLGRAAEAVAFDLPEDVFSCFEGVDAFLDSGHGSLLLDIDEELRPLFVAHMELGVAILGRLVMPPVLGVEVVLAGLPDQEFA